MMSCRCNPRSYKPKRRRVHQDPSREGCICAASLLVRHGESLVYRSLMIDRQWLLLYHPYAAHHGALVIHLRWVSPPNFVKHHARDEAICFLMNADVVCIGPRKTLTTLTFTHASISSFKRLFSYHSPQFNCLHVEGEVLLRLTHFAIFASS